MNCSFESPPLGPAEEELEDFFADERDGIDPVGLFGGGWARSSASTSTASGRMQTSRPRGRRRERVAKKMRVRVRLVRTMRQTLLEKKCAEDLRATANGILNDTQRQ